MLTYAAGRAASKRSGGFSADACEEITRKRGAQRARERERERERERTHAPRDASTVDVNRCVFFNALIESLMVRDRERECFKVRDSRDRSFL